MAVPPATTSWARGEHHHVDVGRPHADAGECARSIPSTISPDWCPTCRTRATPTSAAWGSRARCTQRIQRRLALRGSVPAGLVVQDVVDTVPLTTARESPNASGEIGLERARRPFHTPTKCFTWRGWFSRHQTDLTPPSWDGLARLASADGRCALPRSDRRPVGDHREDLGRGQQTWMFERRPLETIRIRSEALPHYRLLRLTTRTAPNTHPYPPITAPMRTPNPTYTCSLEVVTYTSR